MKKLSALFIALAFLASTTCISMADTGTGNAKIDKSSIGKWAEKISGLCGKINSKENYYTTSSCSGRILLLIDQEKKGEDLFLLKEIHEALQCPYWPISLGRKGYSSDVPVYYFFDVIH